MNKNVSVVSSTEGSAYNKNLSVKSGETILLSPDSERFQALYKEIHPRTIEEVRNILGFSETAANAVKASKCCEGTTVPAALVAPEDLSSPDKATRLRARNLAYKAAHQYVRSADPSRFGQWKTTIDQFLGVTKAILHWVELQDIDIEEGGTLLISANTQAVHANNVRIHGTGRIVCQADVTLKVNSLQGIQPLTGRYGQVSTVVEGL